jgi:hypothetical protein
MGLASKLGSGVGTATAYFVHYASKGSTPVGLITLAYHHRKEIQQFAVRHALDKNDPNAVQDNLFKCLDYID